MVLTWLSGVGDLTYTTGDMNINLINKHERNGYLINESTFFVHPEISTLYLDHIFLRVMRNGTSISIITYNAINRFVSVSDVGDYLPIHILLYTKYKFRGLMIPVFTPFDSELELNLKEIPKYANIILRTNVKGILVNGTVGEGISMTTEERKLTAEAWIDALKSTDFNIMVHVGGTNVKNVCELAKHAESLKVNAILCVADPFFRPSTPDDLVKYLQIVSAAAPRTPLLYYHIPSFNGIEISMKEFVQKAYDEVPTFAGLKYTHNNMEEASQLTTIQDGILAVLLGNDMFIPGALTMGIDSFILSTLNFASEEIEKILKTKGNDKTGEALSIQRELNEFINCVTSDVSWTPGFKAVTSLAHSLELGNVRPPQKPVSEQQLVKFKLAYSQLFV